MLVSGVQRSGSVAYIFSQVVLFIGYHKILNIVPCAMQKILTAYLFYNIVVSICDSHTSKLSLPPTFPCCNHEFVCYVCESVSVLYIDSFVLFF